jgi:hypothetical protein
MQTYLETGQNLSTLLEQARRVGEVRIRRENGETFVLKPEKAKRSALDVEGIDLDISTSEIIEFIHDGRKPF